VKTVLRWAVRNARLFDVVSIVLISAGINIATGQMDEPAPCKRTLGLWLGLMATLAGISFVFSFQELSDLKQLCQDNLDEIMKQLNVLSTKRRSLYTFMAVGVITTLCAFGLLVARSLHQ